MPIVFFPFGTSIAFFIFSPPLIRPIDDMFGPGNSGPNPTTIRPYRTCCFTVWDPAWPIGSCRDRQRAASFGRRLCGDQRIGCTSSTTAAPTRSTKQSRPMEVRQQALPTVSMHWERVTGKRYSRSWAVSGTRSRPGLNSCGCRYEAAQSQWGVSSRIRHGQGWVENSDFNYQQISLKFMN